MSSLLEEEHFTAVEHLKSKESNVDTVSSLTSFCWVCFSLLTSQLVSPRQKKWTHAYKIILRYIRPLKGRDMFSNMSSQGSALFLASGPPPRVALPALPALLHRRPRRRPCRARLHEHCPRKRLYSRRARAPCRPWASICIGPGRRRVSRCGRRNKKKRLGARQSEAGECDRSSFDSQVGW